MHVEFVRQDLQGYPIMRRSFRLERLCSAHDGRGRGPFARIPCAERFDRDAKGRRAFRLGQVEPCPNLPQVRGALGHRSRRCHRSAAEWKRMDGDENPRLVAASEMGEKLRKVFQLVGSDRSR